MTSFSCFLGSLELDMPNGSHSQKENRHVTSHVRPDRERDRENRRAVGSSVNRQGSTASLSAMDRSWYSDGNQQPTVAATQAAHVPTVPLTVPPQLAATLAHSSSGSSVLAAAASQAIAATQQMQQGRRSASLKASYEALQQFTQSTDVGVLGVTPSLTGPSSGEPGATGGPSSRKQKK